jgi:5,6-dimethylbenzimidazole synthase
MDESSRRMREPAIFDDEFRRQLRELFAWRRDVRRFQRDPLPAGTIERLIEIACLSPSVGLSQPWRFVIVDDPTRRAGIIAEYKICNADAIASYAGERATRYTKLKLAGLEEAPAHLAVLADRATDIGHGLGRRTMPEMLEYSVVSAIAMMWLAARAEGIGMGWVSILDPSRVTAILQVPEDWRLIGYFCLGYPQRESDQPELECAGWESRRAVEDCVLRR